jgi:hypothetical protein
MNKKILFRLASANNGGNKNDTFQISPNTGLITTKNIVVDREGIPFYQLIVEAVDQVGLGFIPGVRVNMSGLISGTAGNLI